MSRVIAIVFAWTLLVEWVANGWAGCLERASHQVLQVLQWPFGDGWWRWVVLAVLCLTGAFYLTCYVWFYYDEQRWLRWRLTCHRLLTRVNRKSKGTCLASRPYDLAWYFFTVLACGVWSYHLVVG